jgi:hypothetical protein
MKVVARVTPKIHPNPYENNKVHAVPGAKLKNHNRKYKKNKNERGGSKKKMSLI